MKVSLSKKWNDGAIKAQTLIILDMIERLNWTELKWGSAQSSTWDVLKDIEFDQLSLESLWI